MASPRWYQTGWTAFNRGHSYDGSNPFPEGTVAWHGWRSGWKAAEKTNKKPLAEAPVDGPSPQEEELVDAHVEEAKRLGLTFTALGKGISENSIESATDQGVLMTERIDQGTFVHYGPKNYPTARRTTADK